MDADKITEQILASAFEVSNSLGCGFLEKVYERALLQEIRIRGFTAKAQATFRISYKGCVVGEYVADLLVEDQIIVELKCVQNFSPEHLAQCINYLKASDLKLALMLNFQHPKLAWKRVANGI
jgi:GxxExxY protein